MTTHHPLPADLTTGSVVLDIGDDVGALLIHTGADRVGEEIEVERVGDGRRTHASVLARRVGATVAHAAVYADLHAGDYRVLRDDGTGALRVRVEGGRITVLDWRRPRPSPPPAGPPIRAARGAATAR
jgi:hypothetical protein